MQLNIYNFEQPALVCSRDGKILAKNFLANSVEWIAKLGQKFTIPHQEVSFTKHSFTPIYFVSQQLKTKIFSLPFKDKGIIFYFLLLKQEKNFERLPAEQTPELTKLYQELRLAKDLVYKDSLTGLLNRNYWERLTTELTCESFCLLFLDLDNFKHYNDEHGHLAGDALLREIALVFRANIRQSDLALRYAGDEFLIIAKNTQTGEPIAQKIRASIAKNFALSGITVSIGIGYFPKNGKNLLDILQFADNKLYLAKKLGKNKIAS